MVLDMAGSNNSGLFALLQLALILRNLGFQDLKELGCAKIAWDYHLSHHEIRLLELIADGFDNNAIAEHTGISEQNTIKKQISSIFKKLGVRNRARAASVASYYGLTKRPVPPAVPERVNGSAR